MKSLVFLGLALILTVSLAAVACAPKAAPTTTGAVVPKADLTKAQADLATEKQKSASLDKQVKDLQAQLVSAGQKPANVYHWEPATWEGQGCSWDWLVFMADWLNATTQGRIVDTPSQPGAVCPVEEQTEACASGVTQAMTHVPAYYAGKIPLAAVASSPVGLPTVTDVVNCLETFQDGAAEKLYIGVVEKLYNVKIVALHVFEQHNILSSNVKVSSIADLKGVKIRSGDEDIAVPLAAFGAATTWFPGTEIYTSLATGVVDAFTYGSAYDHWAMSAQEVTKYWLKYPGLHDATTTYFIVNRDVWNEMPEDLQKAVLQASDAGQYKQVMKTTYLIDDAWKKAIAYGIIPIYWSADDAKLWTEQQMIWTKKYTDQYPDCAAFMKIVADYRAFKGF
jgi:TRAP-type mannitol/chloroaromatic compound transport system substrate-binding protein